MAIHFSYKEPHIAEQLEQGDVLSVTPELRRLLETYHPYYAQHPANKFYLVLTQSCDLIARNGARKARYVAIAPVRPLPKIIEYEFESKLKSVGDVKYGSTRVESDIEKFLERLYNNNEASYFYLEPEPTQGFSEPMCAMLPLAISFKADNYPALLAAKVVGLEDSFQAKLGWLIGQLYSRVGTRDFEAVVTTSRAKQQAKLLGLWIDVSKIVAFEKQLNELRQVKAETEISDDVVQDLIINLPSRKGQAVDVILDLGAELGHYLTPSPARRKFRQKLENSTAFSNFFAT